MSCLIPRNRPPRSDKVRLERNATVGIHLRIPVKQQSSLYQAKAPAGGSKAKAVAKKPRAGAKGALLPGFSLLSV